MKHLIAVPAALLLAALPLFAGKEPAPPDVVPLVKGDNRFALELYGQLRAREGNLFFSPYSVSTALAMTYAGARGKTAEEMASTLHFTLPPKRLHPAMAALVKQVNGEGKKRGYRLTTANALWGQKGYPFLGDFLGLVKDNYGAGFKEVDFKRATEQARQTINAWVEKETNDKIKDLLKEGILTTQTRLVLTNAIYFKGDWASQFKKDLTEKEAFHKGGGKDVNVPLMHQRAEFGYLDGGAFQALEMPYAGKNLSMVVLLPKKANGLADLEKKLTADNLTGWLGRLRKQKVEVALPRFKLTAEFTLKKELSEMGMPLAFSRSADFSGIDGRQDLFIQNVVHKAFVDVNEEGTEAAAATGVVVGVKSAPPAVPVFRADHPFVFLIRDTRSGSFLFLGRLAEPR